MGKRLFVGNLSFKTTSDELNTLFSQVGTPQSAVVMTDRETGRSRGFGFVEMATDEEAERAIGQFNGYEFQGRNLNVSEARERTPGAPPRSAAPRPPRSFESASSDNAGGFGRYGGGFDPAPDFGGGFDPYQKPAKGGGSRRNLRARKRSL